MSNIQLYTSKGREERAIVWKTSAALKQTVRLALLFASNLFNCTNNQISLCILTKVNTVCCPWGIKFIWRAKYTRAEKTQIAIVIIIVIIIITVVLIMQTASIRIKYSFIWWSFLFCLAGVWESHTWLLCQKLNQAQLLSHQIEM